MSLIAQIERGEFKEFLEVFYEAYHNPKPKAEGKTEDEKIEQEIAQALKRFHELLIDESKKFALSDARENHGPYAKLAKENPLLIYFCRFSYWKDLGFAQYKQRNHDIEQELTQRKIGIHFFNSISGHELYSAFLLNLCCISRIKNRSKTSF